MVSLRLQKEYGADAVAPGTAYTRDLFRPESRNAAGNSRPWSSSPTAPIISTRARNRASAIPIGALTAGLELKVAPKGRLTRTWSRVH